MAFGDADSLDMLNKSLQCKHCKKPIPKAEALSHFKLCGQKKQEKARRKKEAKDAKHRLQLDTHTALSPSLAVNGLAKSRFDKVMESSPVGNEEDDIIKCFCGFEIDDGNTVLCDRCETSQHIECYYYEHYQNGMAPDLGSIAHACVDCMPRFYDKKGAVARQRDRFRLKERKVQKTSVESVKRRAESHPTLMDRSLSKKPMAPTDDSPNDIKRGNSTSPKVNFKFSSQKLLDAASNGRDDELRAQIAAGADLGCTDVHGRTALHRAILGNKYDCVCILLEHGAPINARDIEASTPLHLATQNQLGGMIQLLIHKGADIETEDNKHRKPLIMATKMNDYPTVQLLVKQGADLESEDTCNYTALTIASRNKQEEIVRFLLDSGAKTEAGDHSFTPLLFAARIGNLRIVRMLLAKQASIETKDAYGNTPLMRAARFGHTEIAQLLIDNGARVDTKNKYGLSAYQIALDRGHKELAQLLEPERPK